MARRAPLTYLSMSPTTKKIDPRIAMRSGSSEPGSIAGSTDTFEKANREHVLQNFLGARWSYNRKLWMEV